MMTEIMISVRAIMSNSLLYARTNQTFMAICRLFHEMNIHHLPVLDEDDTFVGIISSNDVLKALSYGLPNLGMVDEASLNRIFKVEDIMTPQPLVTIDVEESVRMAVRLFNENKIHALPVLENGKLIGIVTSNDLMEYFASKEEDIRFI